MIEDEKSIEKSLSKETPEEQLSFDGIGIAAIGPSRKGPIPSPEDFAGYEATLPGSAHRILLMAEKQSAHRQQLENQVISNDTLLIKMDSRNSILGVIYGFVIGLAAIIGGVFLVWKGHPWSGGLVNVTAIGGLVLAFITGIKAKVKEPKKS